MAIPENEILDILIANFNISNCAEATINGELQQSAITPNDFTEPVINELMAQNGDGKEWTVVVVVVTSLVKFRAEDIKIFPNPACNQLMIRNAEDWHMEKVNPVGVSISQSFIKDSQMKIDISDLDAGIYLLHFTNGAQEMMQRVVVAK